MNRTRTVAALTLAALAATVPAVAAGADPCPAGSTQWTVYGGASVCMPDTWAPGDPHAGGPGSGPGPVPESVQVTVTGADPVVSRVGGATRYHTAALVTAALDPGVPVVYVASGESFPDALAAGPHGPVLLVPSAGKLPAVVAAELDRLDPARVVIVGGTGVVTEQMAAQVEQAVS